MPEAQNDRDAQRESSGISLQDSVLLPIGTEIIEEEAEAEFPQSVLIQPSLDWKIDRLRRNWVLGNLLGIGLAAPAFLSESGSPAAGAGLWAGGVGGFNLWMWARRRKAIRQLQEKFRERFQQKLVNRLQELYRKDPQVRVGDHPMLQAILEGVDPSTPLKEVPSMLLRERIRHAGELGGRFTFQNLGRLLRALREQGVEISPKRVYPYDNPLTADNRFLSNWGDILLLAAGLGLIAAGGPKLKRI